MATPSRGGGAPGDALAAALGAAFARPGVRRAALMGNGSFVAGELETVARPGLPLTMVVFPNAGYGWIEAGRKTRYGGRSFPDDFGATDRAAIAAAYGIGSRRVGGPGDLRTAFAAAVENNGPTLVGAIARPLQEARAPVGEWVARAAAVCRRPAPRSASGSPEQRPCAGARRPFRRASGRIP